MPIPKKKVAKKENYIAENILNNSITELDDKESILEEKNNILHNNDLQENRECENIIDDFNEEEYAWMDDLDDIDGVDSDDTSCLSKDEYKDNSGERKNNDFKMIKDYETPEEFISKINTPEYNFCGYKITSLAEGEVFILKNLNLNEEMMSNYCLSKNVFWDYLEGNHQNFKFNKQWGFPYNGNYIGYILNCEPSNVRSGEYYVEFLANNYDVCKFKFSTSFRDPVYTSVKHDLGIVDNVFKQSDFSCIKNYLVIISVENVYLNNGTIFSKITRFKIIEEDIVKMIDRLASDMMR